MRGTVELKTDRLILRRHKPEDADTLYEIFGSDPQMFEYSGWNPYQTREMAKETVKEFISSYSDVRFYGWGIEQNSRLIGTIGAYDYDTEKNQIEIGMSIERISWGRGYATEALTAVLRYLTEQESVHTVTAWCADDNIGSMKVMQKAGMQLTHTDKDALEINGKKYDKLSFEYCKRR